MTSSEGCLQVAPAPASPSTGPLLDGTPDLCVPPSTYRTARRLLLHATGGWVKPGRFLLLHSNQVMPSRQERWKAERDAAKRAPAKAGAAGDEGAAGAAAALANLNVNPLGDWTTQTEDHNVLFQALGVQAVIQMAADGDRAAQYSRGYWLMVEANGFADELVAADRCHRPLQGWHFASHGFRSLTTPRCVVGGHLS